jgi:hypothetical protein
MVCLRYIIKIHLFLHIQTFKVNKKQVGLKVGKFILVNGSFGRGVLIRGVFI